MANTSYSRHNTVVRYATGESVVLSFCSCICDVKVEVALRHGRLAPDVMVCDKFNRELSDDRTLPPGEVTVKLVECRTVQYVKALIMHASARHPCGVDPVIEHMAKNSEAHVGAPNVLGQALVTWLSGTSVDVNIGMKLKVAERLVAAKADLTITDHNSMTPLQHACVSRMPPIVRLLLQNGANANETLPGGNDSILSKVASLGYFEMVIALVNFKADIAAKNRESLTPLHLAVRAGSSDTVSCLLSAKANVNKKAAEPFGKPLHMAVRLQHHAAGVCSLLLSAKADLQEKNSSGLNAFHVAVECGAAHVVSLLIGYGASVNEPTDVDTPLHLATRSGEVNVIEQLLFAGAVVNAKNRLTNTALHSAASRGFGEGIVSLLAAKANINAKNSDGKTALHFAVEKSMRKVIPLLINAGGDVVATNTQGHTPAQLTSSAGILQMLKTTASVGDDKKGGGRSTSRPNSFDNTDSGSGSGTKSCKRRTSKESNNSKEHKEPKEPKKSKEHKEPKEPKKSKEHKELNEPKKSKEHKELNEYKEQKEPKKSKVHKVPDEPKEPMRPNRYAADVKKRPEKVPKISRSEPSSPKKIRKSKKEEKERKLGTMTLPKLFRRK